MLFDLFYYSTGISLLSVGAFGLYYWIDGMSANAMLSRATWHGMKTYIQINEYLTGYLNEIEKIGDEIISNNMVNTDEERDRYIHYSMKPDESIVSSFVNEQTRQEIRQANKTDLELVQTKINDDKYYKILEETDVLPIKEYQPLEKLFIQVELEQKNKKLCIHEHLDNFYLVGNKLFTKPWLKWYLNKFYNEELEEEYTLHIIDKDVNIFTISASDHILLTVSGYEQHINDKE